jgi:cell division protein FtsB
MKRFASISLFLVALAGLAYYVWTHPNVDRMRHLKREYERLQRQNDALARQNDQLRRRIEALRGRSRLAERLARQRSGLARPDEMVFQFQGDEGTERMNVQLQVESDRLVLAGQSVTLEDLEEAIERLRNRWPRMDIQLEFADDVGVLRRSRVRALVDS